MQWRWCNRWQTNRNGGSHPEFECYFFMQVKIHENFNGLNALTARSKMSRVMSAGGHVLKVIILQFNFIKAILLIQFVTGILP